MKKFISLFFLILSAPPVFAGTLALTTYYQPPSAAYNAVKLSTNYTASINTAAGYCNGTNNGSIFINNVGVLYTCTGTGTAAQYCTNANNGSLVADSTGTLHVCINNGHDSIYPQQCFNNFCSYVSPAVTCAASCPQGFSLVSVGVSGYDNFQTSATTYMNAYVCCTS